jgi:uncharacterized protein YbjT (DUF2867 family)
MKSRQFIFALLAGAIVVCAGCTVPGTGGKATAGKSSVLVLGATGQLGSSVVRELLASGHPVTALVRTNSDRKRLAGLDIDYVVGDVTSDTDVAAAFKGRRYSAVVVALRVTNGDIHFYEKSLTPIVKYARSAGVQQIIHHGAVGAGKNLERIAHEGWDRIPGMYDRMRDQGVGEELIRASGVPYTIIRNARLYPDATPSTGHAVLTEDDSVVSPMTRADLTLFTVRCLGNQACYNKVYHVKDDSLAWPPPAAARP